jgi:hypothetical protein
MRRMSLPFAPDPAFLRRAAGSPGRALHLSWSLAVRAPEFLAPYRFPRSAERLLGEFPREGPVPERSYVGLMRYFAEGWRHYRTAGGQGAAYPGLRRDTAGASTAPIDRISWRSRDGDFRRHHHP